MLVIYRPLIEKRRNELENDLTGLDEYENELNAVDVKTMAHERKEIDEKKHTSQGIYHSTKKVHRRRDNIQWNYLNQRWKTCDVRSFENQSYT